MHHRHFWQTNFWALLVVLLCASPAVAAERRMSEQLGLIRGQILGLEQELIDTLKGEKEAALALKRAKQLYKLQQKERQLGQVRIRELEHTLTELQLRRGEVREKISLHQKQIRQSLQSLWVALTGSLNNSHRVERLEAPHRRVLALMAERGVRDLESLRADLSDADQLEKRIDDEKTQMSFLFEDLGEQAAVLELNQQLQIDVLNRRHMERLSQLENFKKLKQAESQVQEMIVGLNSRKELERAMDTEKAVQKEHLSRTLKADASFLELKGALSFPSRNSKVLSRFGKSFDPKSNLYVFKKGIDLDVGRTADVLAVAPGKVAFSGELEGYGRVTIIDHGGHYYSLLAHLGSLERKQGDVVRAGERIGQSDNAGSAIYFEIRAKSLPVDPLEWITQKEKSCDQLGKC